MKVWNVEEKSFGETLEYATSLGVDEEAREKEMRDACESEEEWEMAKGGAWDALEEAAIDFIGSKGHDVNYEPKDDDDERIN